MFHLNRSIAETDDVIANKKAELDAARARLEEATTSITKVEGDLKRIAGLTSATEGHRVSLQSVVGTMDGLVAKNQELQNVSSELSALLRQMHLSSEELDDYSSAEEFAKGVLKIGERADSSKWLKELMGDQALVFQQTIRKIAGKVDGEW